jgi:hypothetical protein
VPRYRLRTLLILLAILPPLLAAGWWKYSAWREAERLRVERQRAWRELVEFAQEQAKFTRPRRYTVKRLDKSVIFKTEEPTPELPLPRTLNRP